MEHGFRDGILKLVALVGWWPLIILGVIGILALLWFGGIYLTRSPRNGESPAQ